MLDSTLNLNERCAAAESLIHYPQPSACNALVAVIADGGNDDLLRETAAGSLGALWSRMEYETSTLFGIPDPFFREVVPELLSRRNSNQLRSLFVRSTCVVLMPVYKLD